MIGDIIDAMNFNKKYVEILYDAFCNIQKSDIKPQLKELRSEAIARLYLRISMYERDNYDERLLIGIAEKKSKMICSATSKTIVEKILHPRAPRYDGNEFIPQEYSVPEEELIGWCETSLKAPLNHAAFERYMAVFANVFPDKQIFI